MVPGKQDVCSISDANKKKGAKIWVDQKYFGQYLMGIWEKIRGWEEKYWKLYPLKKTLLE